MSFMIGRALARPLAALLTLLAVESGASAQPADATKQRYALAKKHYDAGEYAQAYEEFRALADEIKSPNAELYVARCLRAMGRLPEAYEAMASALRNANAKLVAEPRYLETRDVAAAQLAELEPLVGKLVVAVVDRPPELVVEINGAPLQPNRVGVPVAAAVGSAVVHVRAPGKQDVERTVAVRGGEVTTVTVALEPALPEPPAVSPPREAVARPSGLGGVRIGGIVTLGLGTAGMATFGVLAAMANHRYATLYAECHGMACREPALQGDIDGGRKLDIGANIALGVGVAGLAAGTAMVVFGRPSPHTAEVVVTFWGAPASALAGFRGAF
jgi:hypothetical protein